MKKIITLPAETDNGFEKEGRDAADEMLDALRQESLDDQQAAFWARKIKNAAARIRRSRKAAEVSRDRQPLDSEELPF